MDYVLWIEAYSEAEDRFMELIGKTNPTTLKVALLIPYRGVLCNRYTIDEETYQQIRSHIIAERA